MHHEIVCAQLRLQSSSLPVWQRPALCTRDSKHDADAVSAIALDLAGYAGRMRSPRSAPSTAAAAAAAAGRSFRPGAPIAATAARWPMNGTRIK